MTGRHALTLAQLERKCFRLRVPVVTYGVRELDERRQTLICRLDRARFDAWTVGRHRARTGELS